MRTDYINSDFVMHVLAALTPMNRLACSVSRETGLRIDDVLSIKTATIANGNRFTVKEMKTGKSKRVYLPRDIWCEMLEKAGRFYVFEHRTDPKKHRTRQSVFKDLKRAAAAYRLRENVAPHSMRKIYAVEEYHRHKDIKRLQRLLNHSSEAVTYIYALADQLRKKQKKRK